MTSLFSTQQSIYILQAYKDICDGTGYKSKSSVFEHLRKLEDIGVISLGEFSQPRCIKLIGYKLVKDDGL